MAINPLWFNNFGQNVADAGSGPVGPMGDPPATGNGIFGANADPVKRDALLATAATLLSGSGYSPVRQTGSEIMGRAMLAGQQAAAQAREAQLNQRYREAQIGSLQQKQQASPFGSIDPDQFTPESLQEFQHTGNYGVLKPRGGLAGMGNVNPGEYTPASVAKYAQSHNYADLVRYVAPAQPSVSIVNGVPTVVMPDRSGGGAPKQNPLSTLETEAEAAARLAREKSAATATGTAAGEATGGIIKRGTNASTVLGMLDLADPLIDSATGSLTGAGVDKLAAVFGQAPKGAEAIAQLKVLQAALMTNMPRMEGPQSDIDVQLYRDAAGQIGDPTVPKGIKKVAVKTVRQLQQKYKDAAAQVPQVYSNDSPEAKAADATRVQSLLDKYAPQ